jgi:hypothetical protein
VDFDTVSAFTSCFVVSFCFLFNGILTVFLSFLGLSGTSNSILGISKNKFNLQAVKPKDIKNNAIKKAFVPKIEFHIKTETNFITANHK